MKAFSRYLNESEEGVEYVLKIRINGTEGQTYLECHQQCAYLDHEKNFCKLFQQEMKLSDDEARRPLRTKECVSAVEGLI